MKKVLKRGCLILLGILCLIFVVQLNQVEKEELYYTEGQSFEKAKVVEIIQDNETENGSIVGNQKVLLEIQSGAYKGEKIEASSSASYLFGAHCEEGMHVVAIVSESNDEVIATVYSVNRSWAIFAMVLIFFLVVFLIGGKKGLSSIAGLVFALICIVFVFLPMIYRGISPILSAIFVIIVTTIATMYFIDGLTAKSITAICGTIGGVIVSGIYAWIFGKITQISGFNVSDIENLVYVGEQTGIQIGELLFAGILIAALGAVMDVGMSIAATQQEILQKKPDLSAKELFYSGMNVGKDMMGTMSNTLILAFAGGSLNTLVYLYAYNYSYLQMINMYSLGIEIMQGVSATMGVVLTVPFTSFVGAILLTKFQKVSGI